jgi:hypothetical protein
MIDMKISEMEKKDMAEVSVLNDESNYPYNLKVYLEPEQVKKLGLKNPQIGQKMQLEAIVEIVSVASENYKGDVDQVSVSFQMKEMMFESLDIEKSEEVMYGVD